MTNYSLSRYITKTLKLEGYCQNYRLSSLPAYLDQTLTGLLLSDGSLEQPSLNGGARLSVILSANNYAYIMHLFNLFEPFIDTGVNMLDVNLNGKTFSTVRFKTITTPIFLFYYNQFYPPNALNNNKRTKIVPRYFLENFTAVTLAHLIQGDGNYLSSRNIIRIYTNSFIESDVRPPTDVIFNNLGLKTEVVHERKDQFILCCVGDNVERARELVTPFMHSSILYRIGMNPINRKFNYEFILDMI